MHGLLSHLATEEQAFIMRMLEHPHDEFLPFVYADWLDERDDRRGKALRLMLDRDKLSRHGKAKKTLIRSLDREIKTTFDGVSIDVKNWRTTMNDWLDQRAGILNCGLPKQDSMMQFEFECPNRWTSLQTTEDDAVRFCGDCQRQVHFCSTSDEAMEHAKAGDCIAVPYSAKSDTLQANYRRYYTVTLGRPAMPGSDDEPDELEEPTTQSWLRRMAEKLFGRGDA